MLSRRALVGKAATVAAGAAVLGGARGATAAVPKVAASTSVVGADLAAGEAIADAGDALAPTAPWQLLSPLTAGSEIAHGWTLEGVNDVSHGAAVITLRSSTGRTARIHFCRHDGRRSGIVATAQFDLLLMNGGEGEVATEEGLAQAVAAVARIVSRNESTASVDGLMTHDERLAEFGARDGAWLR